jgi:hypothetical protein
METRSLLAIGFYDTENQIRMLAADLADYMRLNNSL